MRELRDALGRSSKSHLKKIRNRRYERLRQLMDESVYFSKEEMQQRNPLLYDFYVGQYLTDEEKQQDRRKYTDMSLSSMILQQMVQDKMAKLLQKQQSSEMDQLSVEESEKGKLFNDGRKHSSHRGQRAKSKSLVAMELNSDPVVAEREKYMLQQEFLAAMQANFLDGKDEDIDYSKIDSDEQYDSLDLKGQDEEDDYFDKEEPSWCEEEENETGSQSSDEAESNTRGMELDIDVQTNH